MRNTVLLVYTLLLLAPVRALAAERIDGPLTLDGAVTRVRAAGFDVRAAQGSAAISIADAASARAALRPQIGISLNGLDANESQLGMPVSRQVYAAATLTLPIFTPSAANASRAAGYAAAGAVNTIAASISDAVFATIVAYRRAQFADAVMDARNTDVRDQQDHVKLTELRIASGKSPSYLAARDRASLAVAIQNEEDAAAERDEAINDLGVLLDLSPDSNVTLDPLSALTFSEAQSDVVKRALRTRPSLLAAQQQVQSADATLAAARSAFLPTALLTAQSYNGASAPNLGQSGGQVQLTANLALSDGGSRAAAVYRARGELQRATAMRDQLVLSTQRDVANAYREFRAATNNLSTSQAAVRDAEEQLRVARLREPAGKGIELETLDAFSVAAAARQNALKAVTRYDDAIAAIRHAAGDSSV